MSGRDGPGTRQALVQAGYDALRDLRPADLVAAIRTREIARRAGVSPATFFHHFPTVADYASELVGFVFSLERIRLAGVVTESLQEAQRRRLPAEQAIWYHTNELRQVVEDPDHRIRLGLWALGGPEVDEVYRRFSSEVDAALLPQAQALHDEWGREVRPPLDPRSYLAMQLSLLSGAASRHLTSPEVMTPERYARIAAALSMVMLRPIGDRRTMDDRLSDMNYYQERPTGLRGARRDSTRGRIVDAAAELFGEYGYSAASISHIAHVAKVHVATLYDHFDSKRHLALVLFDRQAEAHLDAAPAIPSSDPLDDLRRHLTTVAELVSITTELARLYLAGIACGDHVPHLDDVVRRSTVALVERLPIEGRDRPDASERLAEDLLITTIGAMLRHPGDGVDQAADAAIRVLRATLSGDRPDR